MAVAIPNLLCPDVSSSLMVHGLAYQNRHACKDAECRAAYAGLHAADVQSMLVKSVTLDLLLAGAGAVRAARPPLL